MNSYLHITLLSTLCAASLMAGNVISDASKTGAVTSIVRTESPEKTPSAVISFADIAKDIDAKTAFKELIKGDKTVVVKFFKSYCPACKSIKESFEALAAKYIDRALFVEVEAEQFSSLARDYKLSVVPLFIIFHKGRKGTPFKRGLLDTLETKLKAFGIEPIETK